MNPEENVGSPLVDAGSLLAELKTAQRRLEDKLAQEEQAHETHLAAAAADLAEGREVDGLTRMLLHAKAANADRAAKPPPPPSRRPPAIEAKPDVFIADSSGNVAAPATVESAPPPPPAASRDAPTNKAPPATLGETTPPKSEPPKPPPFKIEPDPPRSAPAKRSKQPPPGAPYMPGHAEFLSARDTVERDDALAKRQEEARKDPIRYPGGQIPMKELPPDPRPPMEVINFTRVPGGKGIRRC